MKDIEQTIKEVEDALSGSMAKAGHDYKLSLNGLKDMALADALELLKHMNGLSVSLAQSNAVNKYLNDQVDVLENRLKDKRKKGKWTQISMANGNHSYKRCSCCYYVCNGWDIETGIAYDFCPNCGAEMQNGDTNREHKEDGEQDG